MELETTIYIYNENGLLNKNEIQAFCNKMNEELQPDFRLYKKEEIDESSSIFIRFSSQNTDLTIYDHGYVMKVEGDLFQSVILVKVVNKFIPLDKEIFVSPSQRVVNEPKLKLSRELDVLETAKFLDEIFKVKDYSMATRNIGDQLA